MANTNPRMRHSFSRHVAPFAPLALALLMHSASGGGDSETHAARHAPVESSPGGGGFVETCANPHFPPNSAPTTIDATPCTIAGNGGTETLQNEAKNNFCAVGPARAITITDMVNLQAQVQQNPSIPFGSMHGHPLTSKPGPVTDRQPLRDLGEGSEVTLEGFVLTARQEGKESVNCGTAVPDRPSNHDIHISIVQNPTDSECSGVVVEMIPHHRPAAWTAQNVLKVADKKLPVRVTGQLFFDSSHTPCHQGTAVAGDPKRLSLWEVHPVYEFDVCPQGDCSNGNGWVALEEFLKE
jgi:hypothetical protein